jgi:hypothetical protein
MAKQRKPASEQSWAACKGVLKAWPRAGVVALVQELYRLSDDNRRFLHARLLSQHAAANVGEAAKVVRRMVSVREVYAGRFRHADVKRVVEQFEKATDDPAAVAALLLEDLAASLATFSQVGDYEPIVDHAYASMERLDKCLARLDPDAARPLAARLDTLASRWSDEFGYGLSDELDGMAYEWRERLGS